MLTGTCIIDPFLFFTKGFSGLKKNGALGEKDRSGPEYDFQFIKGVRLESV